MPGRFGVQSAGQEAYNRRVLEPMRRARRFIHLDPAERCLVLGAVFLMGGIRLGLSLLSLRAVRRLLVLAAARSAPARRVDLATPEDVARAVTRASAAIPGATCLVQALAVQTLLERRGCPASLRLGFVRSEGSALTGHAWVESAGKVFAGPDDPSRYALVPGLGPDRP